MFGMVRSIALGVSLRGRFSSLGEIGSSGNVDPFRRIETSSSETTGLNSKFRVSRLNSALLLESKVCWRALLSDSVVIDWAPI